MTTFPAQIDNNISLPLVADNQTPVMGETVNRLRNAIIAIENELGVKPSGTYTTVRARLDAIEQSIANLQINGLSGDVIGGLSSTTVIRFQGRPFSSQVPAVNDVISWNGIAWTPSPLTNIVVNVLPSTITFPTDVTFLSGDGYNSTSNPFRIGARAVDLTRYPNTYPDGRIRTIKFIANLEVTNAAADGYVQLKDITNNAIILNSVLTTDSLSSVELSAIVQSGTTDGYLREGCCDETIYEVQIYILNGGPNDQVICRNARLEFTYSDPILVSALVPLALPQDINFICGTEINGFTTPAAMGSRTLDMTKYPITLPDGRARTAQFHVDVEVSAPGVTGSIYLFDATHNVIVSNTTFTFTNTITQELISTLIVGSGSGNLRNDVTTRYEVRAWMVSGSPADRVIVNNTRVTITYA